MSTPLRLLRAGFELATFIPETEFRVIPAKGHSPFLQAPRALNALILFVATDG
jgi:hypothetical protein